MDMETGHTIVGFYHLLEGLVRDGKQCVAAEHSLDHAVIRIFGPLCEICVLLNTLRGLLFAVTLGNLVAETGTDSCFFDNIADCEQGARDLTEACMMIEDGSNAVTDAV